MMNYRVYLDGKPILGEASSLFLGVFEVRVDGYFLTEKEIGFIHPEDVKRGNEYELSINGLNPCTVKCTVSEDYLNTNEEHIYYMAFDIIKTNTNDEQ